MSLMLLMILATIVLGGLTAMVIAFVYAIANRKPGVAIAALVAPLVLVVGVLLTLRVTMTSSPSVQVSDWEDGSNSWPASSVARKVEISVPPVPPMPAVPPIPHVYVNGAATPTWAKLGLVLLICFVVAKIFTKRASGDGQRRGGWGRVAIAAVVFILLLNYLLLRVSYSPNGRETARITQRHSAIQMKYDNLMQRDRAIATKNSADAKCEANKSIDGASIEQIWEKLNEPRIDLKSGDGAVSSQASEAVKTDQPSSGKLTGAAAPAQTPEALARSLERLEHMVKQVSAVADKVSDAGTMIGKAMIAINESIDARSKSETQAPIERKAADIPKDLAPASKSDRIADASFVPQKVEIRIDNVKLNELNQSTDNITRALSNFGFWNFTITGDSSGDERVIAAVGEPEVGYKSKMLDVVIGTAGRQQRPIRLRDVASVEGQDAELVDSASTTKRPSWIDEPPKRIGNVWREVVATEEYATADECARASDVYLLLKTYEHFQQLLGMPHGDNTLPSLILRGNSIATTDGREIFEQIGDSGYWIDERILMLRKMDVDIDFIRREVVPPNREYYESVDRSFGPMKKLYTELEFTPSVDAELRRRWDELRREDSFTVVGAGAGSVLGLIGLVFGLLKVDTWTKGYYTKRLFLGVPAAIIMGAMLLWVDPLHLF